MMDDQPSSSSIFQTNADIDQMLAMHERILQTQINVNNVLAKDAINDNRFYDDGLQQSLSIHETKFQEAY